MTLPPSHLPAGADLTILADDGVQPTLKASAKSQVLQIRLGKDAESVFERRLRLAGLRVEQPIEIGKGELSAGNRLDFMIEHSTLMHAGLSVSASSQVSNLGLTVQIDHSIVGPLCLPDTADLLITDSIVDGKGRADTTQASHSQMNAIDGSRLSVVRSTIFGQVDVHQLKSGFRGDFRRTVHAEKDTGGLVQYSYFPAGSNMALSENNSSSDLVFTSRRYGQPGYAQLSADCSSAIRRGAENGSEIGVFHHLSQPQRADNVRVCWMSTCPTVLRWAYFT